MKKYLLVLVAFNCMFYSCNKNKVSPVPACILQRIEQIKKEPRWNPAAEVNQYTYNGKTVYSISSDCCDQYNMVVDESCGSLCAPGGGITGRGDGKCADFPEKAQFVRKVWKDERTQ